MTVRYGRRDGQRSGELGATRPGQAGLIWCHAVTALWETDPEAVAAVLPPPLSPAERPLVRLTLTIVEMPGLPAFGAGWLGGGAVHGDQPGEYPIFMPMTTEQSVIGGRETYGEPKKIAEVWAQREGDSIDAGISRMGYPLVEVRGTVNEK